MLEKDFEEMQERVLDALARAFKSSHRDTNRRPMPGPEHIFNLVHLIAGAINGGALTSKGLQNLRDEDAKEIERRDAVAEVGRILRGELEFLQEQLDKSQLSPGDLEPRYCDYLRRRIEQIARALPALESPIEFLKLNVRLKGKLKGPTVKPWAEMAQRLAGETQRALKAAGGDPKTFGGEKGVVVLFIKEVLTWMPQLWENEPRSTVAASTILDVINAGRYWDYEN